MAKIYVNLIIKDLWTLEQVPERYREAVAELLATEPTE